MAPDDIPQAVLRDILLDPKDGLSARLLVVEANQTKMEAKQDAILVALNGDTKTKGLIELVRELRESAAKAAERRRWVWRDLFWKGIVVSLIGVAGDVLAKHWFGVGL